MSGQYDDILHLPRPVSPNRKRMSIVDRAAQFSPFAALTGYDAVIRETGRLTDRQFELDESEKLRLDDQLRMLAAVQEGHPKITVTYFIPDERKTGGAYERITGRLRKVDAYEKALILTDGTFLYFSRIRELRGEIFL